MSPAAARVLAATRPAGGDPVVLLELDDGTRVLARWQGSQMPAVGDPAQVDGSPDAGNRARTARAG